MSWHGTLGALFDDLEQQAEGLLLDERDAEVAELHLAEYAEVSLAARLHASTGRDLEVRMVGGRRVSGRLERVGEDWLLLATGARLQAVLSASAIASAVGLSERARSPETWPVTARLSIRSLLRRLAHDEIECVVHFTDASTLTGRVGRVGQDFLELRGGPGRATLDHLVPVGVLAAVQGRA